jgi:hypothetical protein
MVVQTCGRKFIVTEVEIKEVQWYFGSIKPFAEGVTGGSKVTGKYRRL